MEFKKQVKKYQKSIAEAEAARERACEIIRGATKNLGEVSTVLFCSKSVKIQIKNLSKALNGGWSLSDMNNLSRSLEIPIDNISFKAESSTGISIIVFYEEEDKENE